jgi:ADP-heptose:LPS heptosyltransferase
MSALKKILIINPFGIGDVLFTMPVLAALKAVFPESSITYWCNARVKGLLKNNPLIDGIIAGTRGDIKRQWAASKQAAIAQRKTR